MKTRKAMIICLTMIVLSAAIVLGIGFPIRSAEVVYSGEYEPGVYEAVIKTNSNDEFVYYDLQPDRVGEKYICVFQNFYTLQDKTDDVILFKL